MTDLGPGIPETLKHYRLVRRIGTGGMGAVFEGFDRRIETRVAIKVLHSHLAQEESFRERFEREAHVAALLRSPYTVHITDYGFDHGLYFLVMEYVDGESVAQRIMAEGRLDPRRAVAIAADAARALEEAGARGVVHRDIKPDNILLGEDGSVKVADFGVARRVGGGGDLATAAGFIGTSAYAAPEQATDNVDARADIYALGGTLYCMLTGQPPFSGSAADLLRQHQEAPLPMAPLAGLPDQLINIIRRCMEKEREDRYSDASALVGALERAQRALTNPGRTTNPGTVAPAAPSAARSAAPVEQTMVGASPSAAPPDQTFVASAPGSVAPVAGILAASPETVVSSMASIEASGAGNGDGGPPPPFANPPAGGKRGKGFFLGIAAAALVAILGIGVAAAMLGGGGDDDASASDDDEGTPTAREETRTARTKIARAESTREARTSAAGGESTSAPSQAATSAATKPAATTAASTVAPTRAATTAAATAITAPATSVPAAGRILAGAWTYNFVTVSNTCGSGPVIGDEFENSFTLQDANGDGYITAGEQVTIVDGQNGNTIGTYTFTYPAFTFQADLEEGDFVVLRNQYVGDNTGTSLREDHYTVNGRPCVIAFED